MVSFCSFSVPMTRDEHLGVLEVGGDLGAGDGDVLDPRVLELEQDGSAATSRTTSETRASRWDFMVWPIRPAGTMKPGSRWGLRRVRRPRNPCSGNTVRIREHTPRGR